MGPPFLLSLIVSPRCDGGNLGRQQISELGKNLATSKSARCMLVYSSGGFRMLLGLDTSISFSSDISVCAKVFIRRQSSSETAEQIVISGQSFSRIDTQIGEVDTIRSLTAKQVRTAQVSTGSMQVRCPSHDQKAPICFLIHLICISAIGSSYDQTPTSHRVQFKS